eukprot:CAMPEP_0181431842 /NCGR_PEP_ID=MMETSP1110-20121109/18460_1 /TAXON_ID=174948 /ORGANISM="Symbiodinium sp., Strain CCMP421" /LENGTH=293 /DNA_ID=CAMNT_0023555227 /DNA_START=22 /DNA_END=903 /DNA_ORIENTATION=+
MGNSLSPKATDLLLRVLSTSDPVMPAKKEKQPLEDAMNQRKAPEIPTRYVKAQGPWVASKIRISRSPSMHPIHLFQVEVYGADGINYAEKKNGGSARQSSQHFPKSWPRRLPEAECVIDGDRCEGFNHTAPQPSGWLEVSFAERAVEAFAIFNMLGEETCARADGLLVQLLDSSGRVVFQHRISAKEDAALFDPKLGCCQQWVKEDARVIANLSISHKGSDEVKVSAFQLSGAKLAEFTVSLSQPGAIWQMHRGISWQSGVPAHRLGLVLGAKSFRLSRTELQDCTLAELFCH